MKILSASANFIICLFFPTEQRYNCIMPYYSISINRYTRKQYLFYLYLSTNFIQCSITFKKQLYTSSKSFAPKLL